MSQISVGVLSTGTYIPRPRMTSAEIAEASGIPRKIVEEKLGILEKPIPGPDDHPCEMAARASKVALRRAKVSASEIDVIISISEEGAVYVGDEQVSLDELAQRLARVAQSKPDTIVLVRGDQRVPYGRVGQVMSIVRASGLRMSAALESGQ